MSSFELSEDPISWNGLTENKTVTQLFSTEDHAESDTDPENLEVDGYVQWSKSGKLYIPTRETTDSIRPGLYEINHSNKHGLYFEHVPVNVENLVRFPDDNSDKVLKEIQTFWEKEDRFKQFDITFKRGILLYGKPGTGKSSLIKLVMNDVIDRGGIVINFNDPTLFKMGIRALREIHPDMPIVVIMEDIDSILDNRSRTAVLNILDGVSKIEKIVYLATTNYPEKLEARIVNRPSRFDKRFNIGLPCSESRRIYFEFLFENIDEEVIQKVNYDLEKWVKDTADLTISHLRELFVAVVILEDDYEETLETLTEMDDVLEDQEGISAIGF